MIIGVDLGGTKVRAGVAVNGKVQLQKQQLFNNSGSREETLMQLIELIRPLVNSNIKGIGLGVPSVVDIERGIVYNVINIPAWVKVPLKDILEDEFRIPVSINNDVNCFILGEHMFGRVKGMKTVVGITSGTGLGAGIIINNEIYSGNNCGAGEIGLLSYLDHNIEYYASGNFFEAKYNLTAMEAHAFAVGGNPAALGYWREFGIHMGHAIKTIMYSYDPEAIVIGGSLSKAFSFFEESMHQSLQDFTFPESVKRIKIFQSLDEDITLLGAASLIEKMVPPVLEM
ncbi:MAG: ROK family protein [Cyclobacteriaceae bacterium]